ncbi:hypothetical protein F4780DRAFT_747806 [Xylariomycetidae sp. FL0641]|nr:hypothetical protein F4780DRAFT_747806 [Xylariomycetidae sp. FL0641]
MGNSKKHTNDRGQKRSRSPEPESAYRHRPVARRQRRERTPQSSQTAPGGPSPNEASFAMQAVQVPGMRSDTLDQVIPELLKKHKESGDTMILFKTYKPSQITAPREERGMASAKPVGNRNQLVCHICRNAHESAKCRHIEKKAHMVRKDGFLHFCPFHNRPHPLDKCRQLDMWAYDIEVLAEYLLYRAGNAPAFASNRIDWRDVDRLLKEERQIAYKGTLPWTPEWTILQVQEGFDMTNEHLFEYDDETYDRSNLQRLPPQTVSGNAPAQALKDLIEDMRRKRNRRMADAEAKEEKRLQEEEDLRKKDEAIQKMQEAIETLEVEQLARLSEAAEDVNRTSDAVKSRLEAIETLDAELQARLDEAWDAIDAMEAEHEERINEALKDVRIKYEANEKSLETAQALQAEQQARSDEARKELAECQKTAEAQRKIVERLRQEDEKRETQGEAA